jgi:hypothetical protein
VARDEKDAVCCVGLQDCLLLYLSVGDHLRLVSREVSSVSNPMGLSLNDRGRLTARRADLDSDSLNGPNPGLLHVPTKELRC